MITDTGRQYMPSIESLASGRDTVQLDMVVEPWEVAAIFGSIDGTESASAADPVVIYNTETNAYVAMINQGNQGQIDRGLATIEFIKNWFAPTTMPVEPQSKLITTWGEAKARY